MSFDAKQGENIWIYCLLLGDFLVKRRIIEVCIYAYRFKYQVLTLAGF
jgi:hypothetical protein